MNKEDTIDLIRSILTINNQFCSIFKLNEEFKRETGIDIPLYGYGNVAAFLQSIPQTVKVTGTYPVQHVSLVVNEKSAHIVSLINRTNSGKRNPKSKLRTSWPQQSRNLSAKPKTDLKSKSSQLQEGKTKSKSKSPPLQKNETEPSFVQSLICETEPKSPQVQKNETESKSTPVKKKKRKSKSKSPSVGKKETKFKSPHIQNGETESTSSQVQNSCSKSKSKSPKSKAELRKNTGVHCDELLAKLKDLSLLKPGHNSDFLEENETISFENLEKLARVGEYIEIHPCKIYTPHRFYFRFRKSNWRFMRLNYVLQDFYKWNQHVPFVTNINEVTPERMFIVQHKLHFRPKWFRVKVIRVVNEKEILVWFVDYGVSDKVLLENLKYLHREFAAFPRQAVLGSLANIKPRGREWTESANEMFTNLALNKDLVAGVVWVDTKIFCVWMALSCTVGTEVHINDALVEKGHAKFDDCVTSPAKVEEKDNSTKSPVFYYSDISSNNNRLKDMFSQSTSKSC